MVTRGCTFRCCECLQHVGMFVPHNRAAAGREPVVCVHVIAIRCVDATRGTREEADVMVLNGVLGVPGHIAPSIFWNG